MKHKPYIDTRFFFSTSLVPCPYLPDRMERRLITELIGRHASEMHDQLSYGGFRRSHSIAYAPACPSCSSCKAVRVLAREFKPSRSQRRIWIKNDDLSLHLRPAIATEEQYSLFLRYQRYRHGDGDMAAMNFFDYQALIEDTPIETSVLEVRDYDGHLIAACLTDIMATGLSAVYSFFEPTLGRRGLGNYIILWLIYRARALNLTHVYLGFWVPDSTKMSYKTKFQPVEIRSPEGWILFEENLAP